MENWFIKITRQLLWSEIMLKPPEWFKIWLVILMKCNYEDNGIYKRWQLVTKYSFLADECWVSRETVKWFISWARATTLLTPYQLKRGVRIVVTNYDKYQSNPTPTPLPTPLPTPPAINKGRRKEEKNIDIIPTEEFEKFWEMYGKKTDRKKTEIAFARIPKKDHEKLFEVLPEYINATPDVKYRKNPLTWLHGRCWEDEIAEKSPGISIDKL